MTTMTLRKNGHIVDQANNGLEVVNLFSNEINQRLENKEKKKIKVKKQLILQM
jgi:hypothetical protein